MSSAGEAEARRHVAVLPFPFASHNSSMLFLARALAASAPQATFSFLSTATSLASLGAPGPPNLLLVPIADGLPEGYVTRPGPGGIQEQIGAFLASAPDSIRSGLKDAEGAAGGAVVRSLVGDAFVWMAGEVAGEVGVTWVPIWTCAPGGLSAHLYTDLIRKEIGVGEQVLSARGEERLHFIPGMSAMRVRDLPEGIVSGDLESVIPRLLHRMAGVLPGAVAVGHNTFEGLDPLLDSDFKAKFKNSIALGPFSLLSTPPAAWHDTYGCLSWLDGQPTASVAYISFGTMLSPPPLEIAALADGLEASGIPFLWSMKDKAKESLAAGFLDRTKDRGLVVPWAPQARVLSHAAVGVFVTHNGWNSVTESMAGGVPMISRPFFGDQRIGARTVSVVWGVGVGLEGGFASKEAVAEALQLVVRGEEGRVMRRRAAELKEKLMVAIGPGGSSREGLESLVKIVCGD